MLSIIEKPFEVLNKAPRKIVMLFLFFIVLSWICFLAWGGWKISNHLFLSEVHASETKKQYVIYPTFLNSTDGMRMFIVDLYKLENHGVNNIFAKYDIDVGEIK